MNQQNQQVNCEVFRFWFPWRQVPGHLTHSLLAACVDPSRARKGSRCVSLIRCVMTDCTAEGYCDDACKERVEGRIFDPVCHDKPWGM